MDVCEPRVRRRGFFLHSDTTGEPETGEHENPEGFVVRVRIGRPSFPRQVSAAAARPASGARISGGRSISDQAAASDSPPRFRSGTATGRRQRLGSPR
jgi:hypothetical protein